MFGISKNILIKDDYNSVITVDLEGEIMRDNLIYDRYSDDRRYKYEVYKRENGLYEVCVQFKETDEYMGSDWYQYSDINDISHFTDTLERAIEIGDGELYKLA